MKRLILALFLFSAMLILLVCCSDLERPTGIGKETGNDVIVPTTQPMLGSFPPFSDDFESGLDPSVWYLESVYGVHWIHMTEGGNGYAYSPPQNPYDRYNRYTDMLTHREDFTDFDMTCDIRFHTKSWHKDQREIMFRCNDSPYPFGYRLGMSVYKPTTTPPNYVQFTLVEPPYVITYLTDQIAYPWELEQWYTIRIVAAGNEMKAKVWNKEDPEPEGWTLEVVDPLNTYASGRIGFSDYWGSMTDVDNVLVMPLLQEVSLDIKPGSCPNPLNITPFDKGMKSNPKKGGVLPVAILGNANFDVDDIDVTTLLLEGVAPDKSSYEDVAAPLLDGDDCECTTEGPDEYMDLTLKFSKYEIYYALGPVSNGDIVELTITGQLLDGTDISGSDCVRIIDVDSTPKEEEKEDTI